MSDDWKKDRLTIEVKESEKKIMAEAAARKQEQEDLKWQAIANSLCVGNDIDDYHIAYTIDKMSKIYKAPERIPIHKSTPSKDAPVDHGDVNEY